MLRVAHILNELRFSGAEVMLEAAARDMAIFSQPTIIATGLERGDFSDRLERSGYEIAHVKVRSTIGALTSLRTFLLDRKFDLVHIHTERNALAYSLACRSAGIASVRTIHNEFLFTGLLGVRRRFTRAMAFRLGTSHVACSPSVQRNELQRFGLRTEVVNNWFDVGRIPEYDSNRYHESRKRLGIQNSTVCTISIANEAPAKNLKNLFLGVLAAARRGLQVRHFHCGRLSVELSAMVERSLGCIVELGTVNDITPILAAADIFISSSYNEGGPLSLLEAAASGIPSITTRVGLAEAFDGQEGIFFIAPTVEAISSNLIEVASISVLERRKVGMALAGFTRTYFEPVRGVREYLSIYEATLGRRL